MKTVMLADRGRNPAVWIYAGNLQRTLCARGRAVDLLDVDEPIPADTGMLHIQLHQDAEFDLAAVADAKRRGVPVFVSCHEYLRATPEQQHAKLAPMLALADVATFTTEQDRDAAVADCPSLTHTKILPVPASIEVPPEVYEKKYDKAKEGLASINLLYFGVIGRNQGLESFMDAVRAQGESKRASTRVVVVGGIPEGQGDYIRDIMERNEDLGIRWRVKEVGGEKGGEITNDEIAGLLVQANAIYLPFPGKGGAVPHSSRIACCAKAGTAIISHRGLFTPPEDTAFSHAMRFVKGPEEVRTILEEWKDPQKSTLARQLEAAKQWADNTSLAKVAESVDETYKAYAAHDADRSAQSQYKEKTAAFMPPLP